MRNKKKIGFTLLEIIIVLVIIGILATLAIPRFALSRERVFGREAIANLKMIGAAERIYRMELTPNAFVACSCGCAGTGVGCCNNNADGCNFLLKLSLNTDNWTYVVTRPGGQSTFTATAIRTSGSGCQYNLTDADPDGEPNPVGCP